MPCTYNMARYFSMIPKAPRSVEVKEINFHPQNTRIIFFFYILNQDVLLSGLFQLNPMRQTYGKENLLKSHDSGFYINDYRTGEG